MKFPTELFLKGIEEKKVYYFSSTKLQTSTPHHYICIKRTSDDILILSLCTSKFDTVRKFVESRNLPYETLVFISPTDDSNPFDKHTYINCNEVHLYTLDEFTKMYESEIVDLSGFISDSHYIQILIGINKSPLIDEEIKELLPSPDNI